MTSKTSAKYSKITQDLRGTLDFKKQGEIDRTK